MESSDEHYGETSSEIAIAGMGNYCSGTWANGGWAFTSDSNGGDPCATITSTGGTVRRKGLYANNNWNRVVYRCHPPGMGWVGIYEGWGNAPLAAAFDAAQGHLGCVFNASPNAMPIFDAPFSLAASYTHVSGVDMARAPYVTLDVSDFGQPGSSMATIVDWKGRDKSGQYLDDHAGHDWLMARGTTIRAAADGVVVSARDWQSPCSGSDSSVQKEVSIVHTVCGANGYCEKFLSYYAHFESYNVTVGQSVTKGQIIGKSGNTGCSSDPHLHFGTIRLTNTADQLEETVHFFADASHSDATDKVIEAYGWAAPAGFDPWAWMGYPQGALSVNLWRSGQAPSTGNW